MRFRPPGCGAGEPGQLAASAEDTAACGRFGQHVLAGVRWESPEGRTYQLAGGSRAVTGISARGSATGESSGPTLAVRTAAGTGDAAGARLTGRLRNGGQVTALR